MNSDVRSDAAEATPQISLGRLRKEIHDIVDQTWASLAQSRGRDFPLLRLRRGLSKKVPEGRQA